MTINATTSSLTQPLATGSTSAQSSSTSSAQSSSTAQPAATGGGDSGGSSSAKTVVSDVSVTMNGITTTTITYSDGSVQVETSQGAQSSQASQNKTYTAQGTIAGTSNGLSSAGSAS